ncbi:hypothetical protein [uncultured Sphingomonas sp.]|nr:hypothetical protein [uncultured Sphingomonas sp.]
MTDKPKNEAKAAKGAARAAIGKLIGDDAAVRRGEAEKADADAKPKK